MQEEAEPQGNVKDLPEIVFGKVFLIVAIYLLVGWLDVISPQWIPWKYPTNISEFAYHAGPMLGLELAFSAVLGLRLLNRVEISLSLPRSIGWLSGMGAGVLLSCVVIAMQALLSPHGVHFVLHLNWDHVLAELFSNLYEEFIFRGVLLALLLKVTRHPEISAILSSLIFVYGHLFNRGISFLALLFVFVFGLVASWLTLRYKSILPSYVAHFIVDVVPGAILAG